MRRALKAESFGDPASSFRHLHLEPAVNLRSASSAIPCELPQSGNTVDGLGDPASLDIPHTNRDGHENGPCGNVCNPAPRPEGIPPLVKRGSAGHGGPGGFRQLLAAELVSP